MQRQIKMPEKRQTLVLRRVARSSETAKNSSLDFADSLSGTPTSMSRSRATRRRSSLGFGREVRSNSKAQRRRTTGSVSQPEEAGSVGAKSKFVEVRGVAGDRKIVYKSVPLPS